MTKTMSAVLVELLERSDKMADDIFEAMDVNKDGIVPRKEFEKEFLTSMQSIVNMQVSLPPLFLSFSLFCHLQVSLSLSLSFFLSLFLSFSLSLSLLESDLSLTQKDLVLAL